MAVFEHIEKLKRDYTDKFVLVDDRCAELARFKGQTGRVKTVNMNGRALVEFDHFANIGWFDIDVDFLKVIDRPPPKEEKPAKAGGAGAKKPAAKSASTEKKEEGKQLSPLEMARMQDSAGKKPAAGPAPSTEGMSIAEKLAAARGDGGAAAPPAEASGGSPAAPSAEGMSIAEKLAAARGEAGATSTEQEEAVASEPQAVEESEIDSGTPEQESDAGADQAADDATESIDRSSMSVADMIAWCRKHDGQ